MTIRIGTRRSQLAMTQTGYVADLLRDALGRDVELVEVTTQGDVSGAPLATFGGVGVFVGALRDALLRGQVDLAVHSLKDLPTTPHEQITVAAVPVREDPRDVVVAREGLTLGELPHGARIGTGSPRRAAQLRALGLGFDVVVAREGLTLGELPHGARIGTGSPRRAAQLRALGLGFDVVAIRGNVDTRIRKVAQGDVDAVVLARAGIARLGRLDEVTEVLDPLQMLPAPGQGALAVECRAADSDLAAEVRSAIDDPRTRAAVSAERSVLAALEAGCSAPVGALAEVAEGDDGEELWLRAVALSEDGAVAVRRSANGRVQEAERVGRDLAEEMLADGASGLIEEQAS